MDILRHTAQQSKSKKRRRQIIALLSLLGAAAAVLAAMRAIPASAPTLEKGKLWIGQVQRGPLVREVQGPGTLVPVEIRWLSARSNGQVDQVVQKPGAVVKADTIVARLTNSELELAALEAEQEVSRARSRLAQLKAEKGAQRLAQRSAIATLTSEVSDAERRASADNQLAKRGFLSELEQKQTLSQEQELRKRLDFEQKRLSELKKGSSAQLAALQAEIAQLQSIAEFRRREVQALTLRAGTDGVLAELTLEPGQWVTAGAPLGKVVKPERLKAVVRLPETQTQDLALGQVANIDIHGEALRGRVARIDPAAQGGNVHVDVTLEGDLPAGVRPDLNIRGTIVFERLENVLSVTRPAGAAPGTRVSLFRLAADEESAGRVQVTLGRSSVQRVEVTRGLNDGDQVILSELTDYQDRDLIRLR